MKIDESDRLHAIIQGCARDLPEGWNIELNIEQGGGGVELFDPSGDQVEFPSNLETLHEQFTDALTCAIETAAKRALVVNYPDPHTLLIKREIDYRKLVFFQSKVTHETGIYSQTMAIGVGTEQYADHPRWCILRVSSKGTPEAHYKQRLWLEDYLSGPDWEAEIGFKAAA